VENAGNRPASAGSLPEIHESEISSPHSDMGT
jgi:hypothetical protein